MVKKIRLLKKELEYINRISDLINENINHKLINWLNISSKNTILITNKDIFRTLLILGFAIEYKEILTNGLYFYQFNLNEIDNKTSIKGLNYG